jgi:hypothetical protein
VQSNPSPSAANYYRIKALSLGGLVAQRLEQRTHNGNLSKLNKRVASGINNLTALHCPSVPTVPDPTTQKQRKFTDLPSTIFQSALTVQGATTRMHFWLPWWMHAEGRIDTHGNVESRRALRRGLGAAPSKSRLKIRDLGCAALGKVCHKLQIPLPGRGYWTKKEFGKRVERLPLPVAKNLHVVQRFKFPPPEGSTTSLAPTSEESPTDPEYLRIVEYESRKITLNATAKWHPLVKNAEQILKQGRTDERGILQPPRNDPCLDLRVSKESLGRALVFINAVILALEAEGCFLTLKSGKHETGAQILGHRVHFAMAEKAHVVGRREVKEYSWTRTVVDYKPTGELEFRVGN